MFEKIDPLYFLKNIPKKEKYDNDYIKKIVVAFELVSRKVYTEENFPISDIKDALETLQGSNFYIEFLSKEDYVEFVKKENSSRYYEKYDYQSYKEKDNFFNLIYGKLKKQCTNYPIKSHKTKDYIEALLMIDKFLMYEPKIQLKYINSEEVKKFHLSLVQKYGFNILKYNKKNSGFSIYNYPFTDNPVPYIILCAKYNDNEHLEKILSYVNSKNQLPQLINFVKKESLDYKEKELPIFLENLLDVQQVLKEQRQLNTIVKKQVKKTARAKKKQSLNSLEGLNSFLTNPQNQKPVKKQFKI